MALDEDRWFPEPPKKGEKMFRSDDTLWPANARVGRLPHSGDRDPPYSEGYRMAARQLTEGIEAKGERGSDQDYLVYPIIFLYRHHLELVLKRLIDMLIDLSDEPVDEETRKDLTRHNLAQLWACCKRIWSREPLRDIRPQRAWIEGVESYIQQISAIDEDSEAFRYPRKKRGGDSIPEGLKYINIVVFSGHMERLCGQLDGFDSYLDYLLESRNDMRAEMYDDMMSDRGY